MKSKDRNKKTKPQVQQQKSKVTVSKSDQNKWIWWILSVVFITTFAIYFKAIKYDFLTWDDNLYITENIDIININWSNIKLFFTKFYANNYHPITMLFYALEYKIGSGNASIFHFNNILLHLFNVYLGYLLIRKISPKNISVAIITSAFFAIHPMHVESVAWVAERKDVLYTFFFLLSLITYSKYLKSEKLLQLILAGIFFILSCLSKSAAVILPLVMLLFDYYSNRKFTWKMLMEKIPFFAISLIFGIVAMNSQAGAVHNMAPNMSSMEHFLIITYSIISYIFKAFVPLNLSAFYPYPLELGSTLPLIYYISFILIGLLLFFVWYSKKWGKDVIFGFLFFIITIVLVLQFVPVGGATMADRYTYIPYIGLFFIIGKFFEFISNNAKRYINYFLVVLIISFITFSVISSKRVELWKNDEVFFTEIIENYPYVSVAYANRGSYYLSSAAIDNNQKIFYYEKALNDFENALKYSYYQTDKAIAYNNIGLAKSSLGNFEGAIEDHSKSIKENSSWSKAYYDRGIGFANYYAYKVFVNNKAEKEKYLKKAIDDFENYIKYAIKDNDKAIGNYNIGCVKFELKDYDSAIQNFNMAIKYNIRYSEAYNNRGSAKNVIKDYKGAILDFNKVIEFNSQNAIAYFNRGVNEYAINELDKAIADFSSAINIDGNLASAYTLRGNAYLKLKKHTHALNDFNNAIKLNPQDINSIQNRDMVKSLLENSKK